MYLRDDEYLRDVDNLKTGMVLARSVYVERKLLFKAGTELTRTRIETLRNWEVQDVIVTSGDRLQSN
ncbi:MAG: hypothetical protein ABEK50_04055 [bacterium]